MRLRGRATLCQPLCQPTGVIPSENPATTATPDARAGVHDSERRGHGGGVLLSLRRECVRNEPEQPGGPQWQAPYGVTT